MTVGASVAQAVYGVSAALAPLIGYAVWRHRDKPGALPLLASI